MGIANLRNIIYIAVTSNLLVERRFTKYDKFFMLFTVGIPLRNWDKTLYGVFHKLVYLKVYSQCSDEFCSLSDGFMDVMHMVFDMGLFYPGSKGPYQREYDSQNRNSGKLFITCYRTCFSRVR